MNRCQDRGTEREKNDSWMRRYSEKLRKGQWNREKDRKIREQKHDIGTGREGHCREQRERQKHQGQRGKERIHKEV